MHFLDDPLKAVIDLLVSLGLDNSNYEKLVNLINEIKVLF